jgi:hypothetical protein
MEDQPLGIMVVVVVAQALLVLVEMLRQETAVLEQPHQSLEHQHFMLVAVAQGVTEHLPRAESGGQAAAAMGLVVRVLRQLLALPTLEEAEAEREEIQVLLAQAAPVS